MPPRVFGVLPKDLIQLAPDLYLLEQLWSELRYDEDSKSISGFQITYRTSKGKGTGNRIDINIDPIANITNYTWMNNPFINEHFELCSKISIQIK